MSFIKQKGYIAGAFLFLPQVKKMREIVEFEKFQCRILLDDNRTKEFKRKTTEHNDSIHSLRYNCEEADKMTMAGKKNDDK
jgi:hypothetical protein